LSAGGQIEGKTRDSVTIQLATPAHPELALGITFLKVEGWAI
jgi:hypothetical protein